MKYDIENGIIEVQGFDIGGKILISDASEVTFSNKEDGVYEKAKEIKVVMEIETLRSWIEDYNLLDDIEVIKF